MDRGSSVRGGTTVAGGVDSDSSETQSTAGVLLIRIRRRRSKLLYVIIWRASTFGLSGLLGLFTSGLGVQLPTTAVSAAFLVFGVRAFRGPEESDRPRPWWRMTQGPAWGLILTLAFGSFAAFTVSSLVRESGSERTIDLVLLVISSMAAIGYLNSSIRSARHQGIPSQHTPPAERSAD